jgi:putative AdoMet-dependent methyltransferase
MSSTDLFPPSEFDAWAEDYDLYTREDTTFPFDGYERVLDTVTRQCAVRPGLSVLDLGSGTGNLAILFDQLGCNVWGTDFSTTMLEKARAKLPNAHFIRHDLRADWPAEFDRRFDRIVSAYVFHHFELEEKVSLCSTLATQRLVRCGKLVVADLSFTARTALEGFKQKFDNWEDEFYWLADESLAALQKAGLMAAYTQVSSCAGVYTIQTKRNHP